MIVPKEKIKQINETIIDIKNICKKYSDCRNCPFHVHSSKNVPCCRFNTLPEDWKVVPEILYK